MSNNSVYPTDDYSHAVKIQPEKTLYKAITYALKLWPT